MPYHCEFFTSRLLTADATVFLVGTIAASVPAAAGYRIGTTPTIVTPERAKSRADPAISRPAGTSRLVATVPAGHHSVAEFVRRQALTVVASERTFGTFCEHRSEKSRV